MTHGATPDAPTPPQPTRVVVGIIQGEDGRYLLAERPAGRPHGGCWEFPGGKVEADECLFQALVRELAEELGIEVLEATPWRSVAWVYPSGPVRLETFRVLRWRGEARGLEGQRLAWEPLGRLATLPFPPANRTLVNGLRLPDRCLVTPEPPVTVAGREAWLGALEAALAGGIRLIQFRARALEEDPPAWQALGRAVVARAEAAGAIVLANATPAASRAIGAHGVHLTGARLRQLRERPLPAAAWVSAACHDPGELAQARLISADFVVIGAVQPSASHPGHAGMGWERAGELVRGAGLPAYLIGGFGPPDVARASAIGAQGVAGIRAFWPTP
jgi:8-oxo-dGTP diphosphatase